MHFRQMKKSCATIIFLSHFATMAIDRANPVLNDRKRLRKGEKLLPVFTTL